MADNSSEGSTERLRVRRVVTGFSAGGRSTCLIDDTVAEGPGWLYDLWQTREMPAKLVSGPVAAHFPLRLNPQPGGTTFRLMVVPPRNEMDTLSERKIQEIFSQLGAEHTRTRGSLNTMHRTETVDYLVVLSGRVNLHLDEGTVTLGPLDVVIQRGTAHAWSNPGDTDAVLAVILIDAKSG